MSDMKMGSAPKPPPPKWMGFSKTLQGIIIMVLGGLSQAFGWEWFGLISQDISLIFNLVLELGGAVYAAVGRFTAEKPLHIAGL